ncbi:MAG: flagellar motor protein MotB [Lachnospiraceae bacterium]|jgi:chemotaxis protein MotB|nr:flagellar motor protein MotB [Lachnospiraceae bacterium]
MAKKRSEDAPPPGSPAWMTTFGDLMNLLLCFFVLLFSMSTIDAQKFEMIAAAFNQTFSIFSAGAASIGEGILVSEGASQLNELAEFINSTGMNPQGDTVPDGMQSSEQEVTEAMEVLEQAKMESSEELAELITEAIEEMNLGNIVDVDFTADYVQLNINGTILFESGSVELMDTAVEPIQQLGLILQRYAPGDIMIEGHTDNVPMSGAKYSNNDELSDGRARSVFWFLRDNTLLDPARIIHSGRGEYVPIADNGTAEGRAKNRRVEIRVYNALSSF